MSKKKEEEKKMIQIPITINGTDLNPYLGMGFVMNPFPDPDVAGVIGFGWEEVLRRLKAGPITSAEQVAEMLKGCDQEFIDLCVKKYKRGEVVKFAIGWEEGKR